MTHRPGFVVLVRWLIHLCNFFFRLYFCRLFGYGKVCENYDLRRLRSATQKRVGKNEKRLDQSAPSELYPTQPLFFYYWFKNLPEKFRPFKNLRKFTEEIIFIIKWIVWFFTLFSFSRSKQIFGFLYLKFQEKKDFYENFETKRKIKNFTTKKTHS